MAFDVESFYMDFGVKNMTEGHKHCRPGWINAPCPFCTGNPGYHLGFNLSADFFRCWRCGFHPITELIREIAGVSWKHAAELKLEYRTNRRKTTEWKRRKPKTEILRFPPGMTKIKQADLSYLRSRGLDPRKTTDLWELKAGGPVGFCRMRIIAPVIYRKMPVSYIARDRTGLQTPPHLACPIKDEVIHHKDILYGMDLVPGMDVVLVEGKGDVWKMGPGSVGSFGIELKRSQILLLAETYRKVYIMFDDDPQALVQAKKTAHDLSMAGTEAEICLIKGDPGSLDQDTADLYMRQLIGRKPWR